MLGQGVGSFDDIVTRQVQKRNRNIYEYLTYVEADASREAESP